MSMHVRTSGDLPNCDKFEKLAYTSISGGSTGWLMRFALMAWT